MKVQLTADGANKRSGAYQTAERTAGICHAAVQKIGAAEISLGRDPCRAVFSSA
ncbi:MAG: hypothetical protein ACIALR_12400 [Blastopirellula sp. JB062]